MTALAPFAYVQARAQARLAGLPYEFDWRRLDGARTLSAFLEEARATALKPWVAGLSGASDAHDIERGVRAIYLAEIEAVAKWVPHAWRPAVRWVQWLPQLLVVGQALVSGKAPAWMARDPFLASLVGAPGGLDPVALRAAGLGPIVDAATEGRCLVAAWLDVWRSRWPAARRGSGQNLERIVATLLAHQRQFMAATPERTWPLRRELDQRLRHLFHAHLLQPASLFAYLALVAIGLERLRAELAGRALFAAEPQR